MSSIKRGFPTKNTDHQIRIHLPRKGLQGETESITLVSTMPEQFNIGVTSNYTAANTSGETGGISGALTSFTVGTNSALNLLIGSSQLVWTGAEHLVIQVPFHLHAVNNPEQEVSEIVELLMEAASPSLLEGGVLVPPSVKPIQLYRDKSSALTGNVPDFGVTLEMGNFLRFSQLVITSVTPQIELHMWKKPGTERSYPMEALIDVSFMSYFALTDQYIKKAFGHEIKLQQSEDSLWQTGSAFASTWHHQVVSRGVGAASYVLEAIANTTNVIFAGLPAGDGQMEGR